MRRLRQALRAGVVVAALLATAGVTRPVTAAPPDGDLTAEALTRFEQFAADQGYRLIDPVCVASDEELTYVCYALTADGGPLVAETTLDGDVVSFDVIEDPGTAAEPNAQPSAAEPAVFDPLSYFASLFSADLTQVDAVAPLAQAGSPAEAYALFQRQYLATLTAAGGTVERSYVYLTVDGVRVCVSGDQCVEITDLVVEGSQLVSFTVDGHDVATRLGRPGEPVAAGGTTARLAVAYQTVTGGSLLAYLELSASEEVLFELSTATYVDADGNQTPVSRDDSLSALDGTLKGTTTAMLSFPDAPPGGSIRFIVHPADGSAPLAIVVPVTPFAG
jgi:hypothetical protein